MFLVHNGTVLEKEEALVPIYDPVLFADFRVYETLRVESERVVFLQDHLERIFNSAQVIGMTLGHSLQQISTWISQAIAANQTNFGIYRVIIHGDTAENQISQVYIFPEEISLPSPAERERGFSAITFEGERIYPAAKTISRLTQFKASQAFKRAGADEAILVGKDGTVHEGVRSNIFLVRGGKLITPALGTILPGIRRRYAIELAGRLGLEVEERVVKQEELYQADEAFLTSTILELVSLRQIDNYLLSPRRELFSRLAQAFADFKADLKRVEQAL